MVRLNKIPSEFDISAMRDSFMRQFIDQRADTELPINESETDNEEKTVTKQAGFPLIFEVRCKSMLGPPTQKTGVIHLIK